MAKTDTTSKTKRSKSSVKSKKSSVHVGEKVLVHIYATYNNTIVTVTNLEGDVVASSSCGKVGFRGSKKSTAYASTMAGQDAALKAIAKGAKVADVIVNGVGLGRQAAVKGVKEGGLKITTLLDVTGVPHGGCKPRKQRRV